MPLDQPGCDIFKGLIAPQFKQVRGVAQHGVRSGAERKEYEHERIASPAAAKAVEIVDSNVERLHCHAVTHDVL